MHKTPPSGGVFTYDTYGNPAKASYGVAPPGMRLYEYRYTYTLSAQVYVNR